MIADYETREFNLTIDGDGVRVPVRCVGSYCREDGSVQIEEMWFDLKPGLSYNIIENIKYAVVAALAAEAEEQIEGELTRC